MDEILNFELLLRDFEKIPLIPESVPTIIEIAGFPHYENVCSNILAYYFDTSNPHGLKSLMLRSLLDCVKNDLYSKIDETVDVIREQPTHSQKRIDIVIKTEELVIAIENKIYAGIYNDFYDYSRYIDIEYASLKNRLKIILSLNQALQENHPSGFINITYADFIQKIKDNIGEYMLSGDNKAIIFLLDFLQTMQNLNKPDIMNPAILDFFNKNKQAIENLQTEQDKLNRFIIHKISQLKSLIPPLSGNVKQWIYRKYDLVHDFEIDGVIVAIDCNFDFDGIDVRIWIRSGEANYYEYLKKLDLFKDLQYSETRFDGNRIVLIEKETLPLLTPIERIAERLNGIFDKISISADINFEG